MAPPPKAHGGDDAIALVIPSAVIDLIAVRVLEMLGDRVGGSSERTQSPYLDVGETADYLRCSKQRVYDLVHAGALKPVRDGRRVLLRRTDLDTMLEDGA